MCVCVRLCIQWGGCHYLKICVVSQERAADILLKLTSACTWIFITAATQQPLRRAEHWKDYKYANLWLSPQIQHREQDSEMMCVRPVVHVCAFVCVMHTNQTVWVNDLVESLLWMSPDFAVHHCMLKGQTGLMCPLAQRTVMDIWSKWIHPESDTCIHVSSSTATVAVALGFIL